MPFPHNFDETAAQPLPADIVLNSPECSWHRETGRLVKKDITLTGGAGAKVYDLFDVDGIIDIRALWANVLTVANMTTASNVQFVWHDGTNPHDLTDTVDASGAAVGSLLVKTAIAGTAMTFINGSTGGIKEVAERKTFQGTILCTKNGATNKIQLLVTQDGNTSATIRCWVAWVCRHEGSVLTEAP